MQRYSLDHLSDHALLRDLATLVVKDRATTADLLAHVAEVDARKLYLPAAYPSMFAYCVGELRMSEDAAAKRIQAARVARRFPAVFAALAGGRLHLSGVVLLAPHLTEDTAGELLAAATHKTKSEIERVLAERFPRPGVLAWVAAIPPSSVTRSVEQHAPGHVEPPSPEPVLGRSRVDPMAPQSFAVQFTVSQSAHDKLVYAQELLGHQVPSGDIAQVFERALDALIPQLEQRKLAATGRPRRHQRPSSHPRHIPAHVRRAVWQRDGGQCTFVSESGQRCPARTGLEFDHVLEVARGGQATVEGIRLHCRAHNQYQAERTFGPQFMRQRRQEAQRRAAQARALRAAAAEPDPERDVAPWLQRLGFRADEVRQAMARCAATPDASLEERVRLAVSSLARGGLRWTTPAVPPPGVSARARPLA